MDPVVPTPVADQLFGQVQIELDHEGGTLRVSGEGLPTVEIRRSPDTEVATHVPIGKRDPARLTLLVDGVEETPRPAKGLLSRRSYRVEVVSATRDCRYVLVPNSSDTSRLRRDKRRLGVFTSTGDGKDSAVWENGERRSTAAPEPYDAAVGYALAAAYGTGAEPMWHEALDAVTELWP
ncbi:hypothetical protein [Streptomyces althioticus]|uniref:hypothetical protein n=1 Tax=Streptomyces althioticus TaxID=83380 RepID=UPI0033F9FDD1